MTQQSGTQLCQKQKRNRFIEGRLLTSVLKAARFMVKKIKFTKQIYYERHTLDHLSDYLLRDIGLTRDQAKTEINRSIFDTPSARFNQSAFHHQGQREPGHRKVHRIPDD